MKRCQLLMGKTLGQIADQHRIIVPENLQKKKGWVGELLEIALGADAGNLAQPDFIKLGIEMKTLPLNAQGQPKESTYVCTASLQQTGEIVWQDSWVKRKLAHVLWVPIEANNSIPLAQRYIGQAWLWRPTVAQELRLKRDWEHLMDRIVLGQQGDITAKEGDYLQLRPKAAHSRVLAMGVSDRGEQQQLNPKGFYLRTRFTREILRQNMEK